MHLEGVYGSALPLPSSSSFSLPPPLPFSCGHIVQATLELTAPVSLGAV